MALKARLGSLEGLSEELAKEYVSQEDGTFVLDVEADGSFELSDTGGLKKALGTERAAGKAAQQKLQKFADLDPKAAQAALAKVKEMADWDPEKEVAEKVKAREAQLIGRHDAEKTALVNAQKELEVQLEQNLVIAAATKAILAAEGSPQLLLPHVRQRTRMRRTEAGAFIAEVVGTDGNPSIGDSDGNPMTIPQLVEELKSDKDFAPAFKGTGSSGSGAGGKPEAGGTPPAASAPGGKKKKVVKARDQEALNANWEGIAKGEVEVDWS